jgi:hypothetical protein
MKTYVYYMDMFKPIDMDTDKMLELAERDPLEIFNSIKEILSDLGEIREVQVYNIFFNPKSLELVIEYIMKRGIGEVSVKLIHSNNSIITLRRYYEHERRNKEGGIMYGSGSSSY